MRKMSKRSALGLFALAAVCLFVLVIAALLLLPGDVIDRTDGEAQIHIEADRQWVLFPWNCYTLSWAIFNTVSVYVDGGGVVGEYARPECVEWRNAPTFELQHVFTINKSDGSSIDIPIAQRVLVGRAEFWLGLLLVAALVFAADWAGATPWRSRWLQQRLAQLPASRLSLLPERINTPSQRLLTVAALGVIFVAGLLLRLNHVYLMGESNYAAWAYHNYFGGITRVYAALAGFSGDDLPTWVISVYPPGYPFMLSILRNLGFDYTGIRIAQAVFDLLTIFPIFLILRRVRLSLWASLLGALLYALYPTWSVGAVIVLAEWITPAFILWTLFTILVVTDSKKWWLWLVPGLMLGVLSSFRPDALLIVGLVGLWVLWQRWSWRKTVLSGAAVVTGFGILTLVISFSTFTRTGQFSLTSSAGGYALWSGLGMLPNDYGYLRNDLLAQELMVSRGTTLHSREANQYFMSEYLTALRERPFYVAATISYRWFKILSEQDLWLIQTTALPEYALLQRLALAVRLALPGLVLIACLLFRKQKKRLLVILFPLASALITIGIVYYEARYVRYAAFSYLFALVMLLDWAYGYALRPGITFTLDIPVRDDTQRVVDALNDHVAAEGGRVYLAKDAFTRPEHMRAMEPRLDAFLAARRRWDPDGRLTSALAARLFGDGAS